MSAKVLLEAMRRAEEWPLEAQQELARLAHEIDARVRRTPYIATTAEIKGIDRGLAAAREGRYATDSQVKEVLSRHRS